jgi:hypothetical protein
MIDSLATIMLDFPGEANRARCLAHIVNLVVKIILRQFDHVSKKKGNKDIPELPRKDNEPEIPGKDNEPEIPEDEDEELVRVLDKEEKEMDEADEGDDEESDKLVRDVEKIEEAMEGEIKEVSKMVKPVRQVLFKVSTHFFNPQPGSLSSDFFLLPFFFFLLPFFSWLPFFFLASFSLWLPFLSVLIGSYRFLSVLI